MAIKIKRRTDLLQIENIKVVIIGEPGSGKTTLANSADSLILNFDDGLHRAQGSANAYSFDSWEDFAGLTQEHLLKEDGTKYQCVVIDTVGRLLECLRDYLIKNDKKSIKKTADDLSQTGYGTLFKLFNIQLHKIKNMGIDIVLLTHGKEITQKIKEENKMLIRNDILGQTSTAEIEKIADQIGYLYKDKSSSKIKYILDFNHECIRDKNPAGLNKMQVPDYNINSNFLGDLLITMKKNINHNLLIAHQKAMESAQKKAQELQDFKDLMELKIEVEDFNEMINNPELKALITSSPQHSEIFKQRRESLNIGYNAETKQFEKKESQIA